MIDKAILDQIIEGVISELSHEDLHAGRQELEASEEFMIFGAHFLQVTLEKANRSLEDADIDADTPCVLTADALRTCIFAVLDAGFRVGRRYEQKLVERHLEKPKCANSSKATNT
jgi:hypothetical protein